ncbi:hypothetical protein BZA05DRAFT_444149 [Tricharina praecox]|uniref:uncharacterized protein n=1 Tax=Tricharina praecox TaxID=43433 RepID=UPI00221EE0B3|nr:uncharacterized protein BZA05DRAFT_444149 [Tricharina praecox]KAI5853875.1 hypothetical protein BZA05DRAFT_444149 [Tricharina praecox]
MSGFGASPPQTLAMPNIQTYDDDDILMDYEDDFQASAPAPAPTNGNADAMMVDMEPSTAAVTTATSSEEDVMVPERVHLRGVDNLSTGQVKAYVAEHCSTPVVRIEWIDDTSLNLVYESPGVAISVLNALTANAAELELPLLELRAARPFSQSVDSRLLARISRPSDRKERGARERSRYYLFHPEEDKAERFERERKERRPRQDRSRDGSRGDYSRRHYDSREDAARRRNDEYAEDMYDDAGPRKRSRPASRVRSYSPEYRRRSRSPRRAPSRDHRRSRSPVRSRTRGERGAYEKEPVELFPSRQRADRSRSRQRPPKELFPERVQGGGGSGRELFPERTIHGGTTKELFPDKSHGFVSTAAMDQYQPTAPLHPSTNASRELFPTHSTRAPVKELFPSRPSATELFPTRAQGHNNQYSRLDDGFHQQHTQKPKSLADRITMPPKSLAERISLPNNANSYAAGASSGSPSPSDDLFAQKMMSAKGEGLVSDEYGGSGRRRRGRKKADEFM